MGDYFGGAERRRFKRLQVQFSVTYLVQQPLEVVMRVGGKKIETTMLDLSEEGMAIKTATDIPTETDLLINFMLVYAYTVHENILQEMTIEGRVVNRAVLKDGEFRVGIHFTKVSQTDRELISDFIRVSSGK